MGVARSRVVGRVVRTAAVETPPELVLTTADQGGEGGASPSTRIAWTHQYKTLVTTHTVITPVRARATKHCT